MAERTVKSLSVLPNEVEWSGVYTYSELVFAFLFQLAKNEPCRFFHPNSSCPMASPRLYTTMTTSN